jgi:hypothetical protein
MILDSGGPFDAVQSREVVAARLEDDHLEQRWQDARRRAMARREAARRRAEAQAHPETEADAERDPSRPIRARLPVYAVVAVAFICVFLFLLTTGEAPSR